ncbi:MAG TPA: hypothetical protein VGJ20_46125 [Xanthobacteraceae bacterium]
MKACRDCLWGVENDPLQQQPVCHHPQALRRCDNIHRLYLRFGW